MKHRLTILKHLYTIPEFKNFVASPREYPYFNAGFLAINLKKARELDIYKQLIEVVKHYPGLPYADQDILNMVLGQIHRDKIKYIPLEYNVFCNVNQADDFSSEYYSDDQVKLSFMSPKIFHFAGGDKPWVGLNCMNYAQYWWKYAALSPFKSKCKEIYRKIHSVIYRTSLFGFLPFIEIIKIHEDFKNTYRLKFFTKCPL